MEIHGTHKASKLGSEDFISTMPDIVITNILDRLPLQDAVRTDILSSRWRFKWTMLSQLIFDEKFYVYLSKTKGKKDYGRIISRLLLHLKGTITKFFLYIDEQCYSVLDYQDINHWILFLSKNGIKDLSIWKFDGQLPKLPIHLFSCLELKHLKLINCCFDPPANFHGFPNLLSLELNNVEFKSGIFGEFFAQCPMLEILVMGFVFPTSNVKLVEIAKLENLKILSLFICNLDNIMMTSSSSIFELVGILPKLQELDLDFRVCKFTQGGAKKRFRPTFPRIKTLKLSRLFLENGIKLSCVFEMIMSFPNLQTFEISSNYSDDEPTSTVYSPEVDYNTIRLLQLRSVVFTYCKASENELCLIKCLLACSPFLKKIVIRPFAFPEPNKKLLFARKLLKLQRAYPVVDIDLY